MKLASFAVICLCLAVSFAWAQDYKVTQRTKKTTPSKTSSPSRTTTPTKSAPTKAEPKISIPHISYADTAWSSNYGPLDFSGTLGFYDGRFGMQALAAYRLVDSIIRDINESLSVEAGIGQLGVGTFEIPIMARWDFRVNNTKFIFGPKAGLTYVPNKVNFQIGAMGIYQFMEEFGARADLLLGSYTTF